MPGRSSSSTAKAKSLHSALKEWYARPGDALEVRMDGYIIDVVHDDLLVEIQTRSFSAIRHKLAVLVERHPLRLVYPIAQEKWIVKLPPDGSGRPTRRRSPKRGRLEQVFSELVSFPHLLAHPNFSLHVLLVREEELRRYDARHGWRRRGWMVQERRLIEVVGDRLFHSPADLAELLPSGLPEVFTTADLAATAHLPLRLAQQMAYCLREMELLAARGTKGRARLYALSLNR